jgi:hypothetical protein
VIEHLVSLSKCMHVYDVWRLHIIRLEVVTSGGIYIASLSSCSGLICCGPLCNLSALHSSAVPAKSRMHIAPICDHTDGSCKSYTCPTTVRSARATGQPSSVCPGRPTVGGVARILVQDIREVMLMMRMLHCARQVLHDVAPTLY